MCWSEAPLARPAPIGRYNVEAVSELLSTIPCYDSILRVSKKTGELLPILEVVVRGIVGSWDGW